MRALVTRPRDDAAEISEALSTRGFEVVTAPMLIIESTGAVPDLDGAQAVMFTSANGARAFATATPERDIPVFTVGDATAKCALSLGFGRVESAGADSLALVRLVGATLDPAAGAVVHGCGEAVVGDPAGLLEAAGFTVRRAVLYRAAGALALDPATGDLLGAGSLDMVLFFSPRAAQTFVILTEQAGLAAACGGLSAICLSPAVADAAIGGGSGPAWRVVRTAQRPDMAALLEEIVAEAARPNAE